MKAKGLCLGLLVIWGIANLNCHAGTLFISPDKPVIAESWGTYTFTYTVGEEGMEEGDVFRICSPCDLDTHHFIFSNNFWSRWQTDEPESPGWLTVSATVLETEFMVSIGKRNILELMLAEGKLKQGDKIILTWGDTSEGGPGVKAPVLARKYYFPFFALGEEVKYKCRWPADTPCLEVVGKPAVKFHLVAPLLVTTDRPFKLKVVPIDEHGNLDRFYQGKVKFTSADPKATLPESLVMKIRHSIEGIKLFTPGLQTITVTDGKISGTSNIILVSEIPPSYNIFFGDIHGHSTFSDGVCSIEEHYEYARDVACLDFAAVTDHTDELNSIEHRRLRKEEVTKYSSQYNNPPEFITFPTEEWTRFPGGGYGHKDIYFLDESDFGIYDPADYPTPPQLWKALEGKNVFTVPHHTGKAADIGASGCDWKHHDVVLQLLVEIYSVHGCSEYYDNPFPLANQKRGRFVQDAWAKGYKLGVIASGDIHRAQLGNLMPDPVSYSKPEGYRYSSTGEQEHMYGNGLAAVYAAELTRVNLFEAMRNRHTYATTGERILLIFEADGPVRRAGSDGHLPGSEYTTVKSPNFRVIVGGTAKLKKVELIKHTDETGYQTILTKNPVDRFCEFEYNDNGFSQDSFYYVRVTQEDSEMAWSSPIWIKKR